MTCFDLYYFLCFIYFVDLYTEVLGSSVFQWTFLSEVYGSGKFAMKWSSDRHLNHVFGFRSLRLLCLLLELRELEGDFLWTLSFLCCLNHFHLCVNFHSDYNWIERTFLSLYFLLNCPSLKNEFVRQIYLIIFYQHFSSFLHSAW